MDSEGIALEELASEFSERILATFIANEGKISDIVHA